MNKDPGYVYILTNPSFKDEIVKIGLTTGTVEKPIFPGVLFEGEEMSSSK